MKREQQFIIQDVNSTNASSLSHTSCNFTLQRRLSTATNTKYDMYLIKLTTMLSSFGDVEDRKKNMHLCHQSLLEQEKLTRFEDLPLGSFVIFVSHQWNSFAHPDPNGRQLEVLCKIMRDLRDGVYTNVSTDPYHVLLYNTKTTTHKSEWHTLVSNAYIWYVFFFDRLIKSSLHLMFITGTTFGVNRSRVWRKMRPKNVYSQKN